MFLSPLIKAAVLVRRPLVPSDCPGQPGTSLFASPLPAGASSAALHQAEEHQHQQQQKVGEDGWRRLEKVGEGSRRFSVTFYVSFMFLGSSFALLLVQDIQVHRRLRPHLRRTGSHQENHHSPAPTSRWHTDLLQEAEHHSTHLLVGVVPQLLRPLGVRAGRQRPLQEPQLPLKVLQLLLQVDLLLTWDRSTSWRGRGQSAEEPCDQVLTNQALHT